MLLKGSPMAQKTAVTVVCDLPYHDESEGLGDGFVRL